MLNLNYCCTKRVQPHKGKALYSIHAFENLHKSLLIQGVAKYGPWSCRALPVPMPVPLTEQGGVSPDQEIGSCTCTTATSAHTLFPIPQGCDASTAYSQWGAVPGLG